jgi:hypothetical protein
MFLATYVDAAVGAPVFIDVWRHVRRLQRRRSVSAGDVNGAFAPPALA